MNEPNVRSMLLTLGMDSFLIDIAIPFVWFIPGAVDPDSSSIIEINKAMQRGLRAAGFKQVRVTGVLDRTTAAALNQISGPWMEKAFVQLLGDIITAAEESQTQSERVARDALGNYHEAPSGQLPGYFEYQGIPPGPLPGYLVGTPPGPLGLGFDWAKPVSLFPTTAKGPFILGGSDTVVSSNFGVGSKGNIVARNSGTKAAFRNLQRQINRLLSRAGGRISEDGIIGNETLAAVRKSFNFIGRSTVGNRTTLAIAQNAASVTGLLKNAANQLGIDSGANRGGSSSSSSSEPTPGPLTQQQAAAFGAGGMAAFKKYAPFLAIAVGIAWLAAKRKK